MRIDINYANRITLNLLQDRLGILTSKTNFLRLIFPEELMQHDKKGIITFLFNEDSSYQNARSIFLNGNITKKDNLTYSRAHQTVLDYIARQITTGTAFHDMNELISSNFTSSQISTLPSIIEIDYNQYPKDFHNVLLTSAKVDLHLLFFWLILWSVFGERITLLSQCYIQEPLSPVHNPITSPYTMIISYFQDNMQDLHNVVSVDLAFHGGTRWLTDDERIVLIQELLRNHIRLRILITEPQIADTFTKDMRNPDKIYLSFPRAYEMWKQFYEKHSDLVEIRVSPIPPLRCYHAFNRSDSMSSVMFIDYTYGNPVLFRNYTQRLDASSPYYSTLKDEFTYLWKMSENIASMQ